MKEFLKCLAFLPMLFSLSLSAQESGINPGGGGGTDPGQNTENPIVLPSHPDQIIPPSPHAAYAAKYADTPVEYSLGIADISIPIYTIKTGQLEMPITLSYHSNGMRVNDIPGQLGYGWTLIAGGVVTKTVVGLPDDGPYYGGRGHDIRSREQLIPEGDTPFAEVEMIQYLEDVIHNRQDSHYDRYHYSYNGNFGSFLIVKDDDSGDHVLKKTSLSDDSINFGGGMGGPFVIRDPYGNKYHFTATERVSFTVDSPIARDPQDGLPSYSTTSSWFLTKMESADGLDNINISYLEDTLSRRNTQISWLETIDRPAREPGISDDGGGWVDVFGNIIKKNVEKTSMK